RLLTITPLPAPVILAPIHMTDVTDPNVTFSWDAVTEATEYELQISTDGIFGTIIHTQTITTTSYNYTLPASDVYYWRVRAKNSLITGLWTSPQQLTYLLSTPNLLLPDDMTTLASSDVTLTWDSVAGALEYRIQISRDSAFTMILFDGAVGTTSHTQAFIYANTYYWRVQAIYSDWSAVRQFTIQAPVAPNLIAPLDMTTTPIADVNFSWDAVTDATEYHIQIGSDSDFIYSVYSYVVTTTSYAYTMPSFGTYYWRIRAKQNTLWGDWSAVRQFTIEELSVPILTAPVDMTTTDNPNLLFTWDVVASATSYQIQIATDSGFTGVVYDASPTINQHTQ
ncbi:MAG: hypothetical protein KJ043_24045, partial [Anaerolineae bacterium]|nr:hypothetical protein [Anaerolineae bacterium]